LVQVDDEADQLGRKVTKDRDAPKQHKLGGQILPEQTTETSHLVHARKKVTGSLKEHIISPS
jgi:hypothetical protein